MISGSFELWPSCSLDDSLHTARRNVPAGADHVKCMKVVYGVYTSTAGWYRGTLNAGIKTQFPAQRGQFMPAPSPYHLSLFLCLSFLFPTSFLIVFVSLSSCYPLLYVIFYFPLHRGTTILLTTPVLPFASCFPPITPFSPLGVCLMKLNRERFLFVYSFRLHVTRCSQALFHCDGTSRVPPSPVSRSVSLSVLVLRRLSALRSFSSPFAFSRRSANFGRIQASRRTLLSRAIR